MNFLDFIFIALLLYAAWKGFKRGFVIELFTFLALFLGLYAGIHFSDFVSNVCREHLNVSTEYLPAISFTLIFLAVGAMIYFGGKAVEKLIIIIQLSLINKILGFFFSSLKMIFLMGAGILIIESYNEKEEFISEETKTKSLLFYPLKKVVTISIPAFEESTLFLKNALTEEEEMRV
jgi:membrane protein required for colicin V production